MQYDYFPDYHVVIPLAYVMLNCLVFGRSRAVEHCSRDIELCYDNTTSMRSHMLIMAV